MSSLTVSRVSSVSDSRVPNGRICSCVEHTNFSPVERKSCLCVEQKSLLLCRAEEFAHVSSRRVCSCVEPKSLPLRRAGEFVRVSSESVARVSSGRVCSCVECKSCFCVKRK